MERKPANATQRALIGLAADIADHEALGERIRKQFEALAKIHGVTIPQPAIGQ